MNYYFEILGSFMILLLVMKLAFAEVEGRQARKIHNIRFFMKFNGKYQYQKQSSVIFVSLLCYIMVSIQEIFSTIWFLEMIGFIAGGVVANTLSQFLYHYYIRYRFKKDIALATEIKKEVDLAVHEQGQQLMQQSIPSYDTHEIVKGYLQNDKHVAIVSVDGGEFTSQFTELPAITYAVDLNVSKAKEKLADKSLKVTSLTPKGKMPFKDEKIDLVVNELCNYDKFDMYRILKPNGYLIVDQVGSDNYKEIMNMFLPFRVKGRWDQEACQTTLKDIGFDLISGFEDIGHIRFDSLAALVSFVKSISPERVEKYEQFLNFYADALMKIKKMGFFELTTHRFLVIARKKNI